jgi:glucose/arabinose dehydrogenase
MAPLPTVPITSLPTSFSIARAADGLGRARFMAQSPDGRLFVPDMKNLSDNHDGKIFILDNFNEATKKFESQKVYLSGLRNPNSVAFYKDKQGIHWLYIALTDRLVRYKFTLGETAPTSAPEVLATFPDYGLSYKYGGWHLTRTVVIHDEKVYVSVGSSCNSCEEKEDIRASIISMNPDGTDKKFVAKGLRNSVGMMFRGDDLYATGMGSDHLGDDAPYETLYKVALDEQKDILDVPLTEPTLIASSTSVRHYGWPYCYEYEGIVHADTSKAWQTPINCAAVPRALATFPAHAAPLGVAYFDAQSTPALRNSFLVALHGSSDIALGHGYKIVRVDERGAVSDFITGFYKNGTRYGRPVDIFVRDTQSAVSGRSTFFFTDDFDGALYVVYPTQE